MIDWVVWKNDGVGMEVGDGDILWDDLNNFEIMIKLCE
jgi:hypothetical protein